MRAKTGVGGEKHTLFGECQETKWGHSVGFMVRHVGRGTWAASLGRNLRGCDIPSQGKLTYRWWASLPGSGPTLLPKPWANKDIPEAGYFLFQK